MNNLKKTSQSQSNTLEAYNNTDFETEFVKLWVYLESTYANQKFSTIMQSATGRVARAWRMEFKKSGVTPKDLLFFRENLSLLEKPEFIPTSLTLIALLKKETGKECRTNLGTAVNAEALASNKQIQEKRESTQTMREECLELMREIVGVDVGEKKDIIKQDYQPTDKMVRLVRNHNRLLISQGLMPLNMNQCKKRAIEMGLG